MPKQVRTRAVSPAHVRGYLRKADEYLSAARSELDSSRHVASTSLAIHAAINAADALCGMRVGKRAAGSDHDQVLALLREAGADGLAVAKDLRRLLPLKTKAEYEPEDIPEARAARAVEWAGRCVAIAERVARSRTQA